MLIADMAHFCFCLNCRKKTSRSVFCCLDNARGLCYNNEVADGVQNAECILHYYKYAPVAKLAYAQDFVSTTSVNLLLITGFPFS